MGLLGVVTSCRSHPKAVELAERAFALMHERSAPQLYSSIRPPRDAFRFGAQDITEAVKRCSAPGIINELGDNLLQEVLAKLDVSQRVRRALNSVFGHLTASDESAASACAACQLTFLAGHAGELHSFRAWSQ